MKNPNGWGSITKLSGNRRKPWRVQKTDGWEYVDCIEKEWIDKIFKRFPKGTSTYIPMCFSYRCGTRPGERFAFEWEHIDFEKNKYI